MTKAKECKCGHTKTEHQSKVLVVNKVILKRWRGFCIDYECNCKEFVFGRYRLTNYG